MHSKKQGNGLLVVLIIVSAIALGVYSVSDLINTEFRINKTAEAYYEARQAAESIIQSGVADLHARFENSGAINEDELSPTKRPLSISDDLIAIYNDSNNKSKLVIPSITQYTDTSQFFLQQTEIIGGRISPSRPAVIDPLETGNERDPQASRSPFVQGFSKRTVEIFGKATVDRPPLGDVTVYASQYLEIREIPLFSYAIYYNLPMEIAPGPDMDVYGNVHVNGDAWFQSGTGNELNFHGRVTVAGDIYHGRHPDNGLRESSGAVNFTDNNGNLINMEENVSWPAEAKDLFKGTWLESGDSNFGDLAMQIWGGNLQTKDHGIEPIRLAGVSDYIEDTNTSTPKKEAFNSAYAIIQPTLDEIDVPSIDEDPEGYKEARAQKAAEKHKFSYMAGLTIEVSEDGSLNYYSYERDSYENIVYGTDGSPKKVELELPGEIAKSEAFSASGGEIQSGLYDKRQNKNMNLVEVDVEQLKNLVHSGDDGSEEEDKNNPRNWWNGVVYVKFPQKMAKSNRPDNVNPARSKNWGVKLVNGDRIPNPKFAQDKGKYGMSIATNQPMYIEGNYNSDGDLTSGSPTTPDNTDNFNLKDEEAPAALAADAITFLSEGWNDANSNKSLDNREAQPTEVSAAILTGLVPSGKEGTNSYSGGVENFPRFLENWGGKEFVMRGSIVAMFESEVATEKWGGSGIYKAPNRQWGFHTNYTETPPIGPRITAYRGRDLRTLTQEEYEQRVSSNLPY
jgi:hypothetical protein